MSTKEVFISYKTEEFDDANWVKSVLEENGITCWMAPMCIKGGSSYAEAIPQAIRNCKVFVLILSEQCQESKWVPRELDQAINAGKIVLPFMLENCKLKDDFNFYLSNVQRYAAYESKAAALEKMIREIKSILGHKKEVPEDVCEEPYAEPPVATTKEQLAEHQEEKPIIKLRKEKKEKVAKKKIKLKGVYIAGGAILVVVLLIVGGILIKRANQVVIAGERVSKKESSLRIGDATLTAEDVANIGQLKELSYIRLSNCTLPEGELEFLNNAKLHTICLENCGIDDTHLAGVDFESMTQLDELNLQGNGNVTKLEGIEHVADTMSSLNISNTGIRELSFMEGFTELTELEADGNGIVDLSVLASSTKLETISVNNNQLTSLKGLENCIEMKNLFAASNQIASLDTLHNMTVLEKVNLNHNQLKDVSVLKKSAATLRELHIKDNQVSSLGEIQGCVELQYLNIDNNKVASLGWASNLTKLKAISMSGNQIISLYGIENCKELTYIDASFNSIRFTYNLEELPFEDEYGVFVDLSNNQILTLELPQGVNYNFLDVHGNKLTGEYLEVLSGSKGTKLIFTYDDYIDMAKLAENSFYGYYIFECPLDKQVSVKSTLGEYNTEFVTEEEIATLKENYILGIFKG